MVEKYLVKLQMLENMNAHLEMIPTQRPYFWSSCIATLPPFIPFVLLLRSTVKTLWIVITEKSRGEVSLVEQETIENVS